MTNILFYTGFLFTWIFAQYLSYCRIFYTDTIIKLSIKNFILQIIVAGLLFPFVEESVFRSAFPIIFKDMFDNIFYYKLTNAILFGLVHLANYIVTRNIKETGIQVILTTFLGFYLIECDTLINAIYYHSIYNIIGVCMSTIIIYIRDKMYPNNSINNPYPFGIGYNPLKRSKSCSDFRYNGKESTNIWKINKWKYHAIDINKKCYDNIRDSLNNYYNKRRTYY